MKFTFLNHFQDNIFILENIILIKLLENKNGSVLIKKKSKQNFAEIGFFFFFFFLTSGNFPKDFDKILDL